MTNIIQIQSPMTQKQIATVILQRKRSYRHFCRMEQNARDEIRFLRRQIGLTSNNPFYTHRHSLWQDHVELLEGIIAGNRPLKREIQEALFAWIRAFDQTGPAPVHVYAALLSTHHIHVDHALAEGATNLMELIIYKVEDGASTADWISKDAVLHDAVTAVTIREICRNSELKRTADSLIQQMAQENLGRPLRQYQQTKLPNGQTILKPMPPKLTVV